MNNPAIRIAGAELRALANNLALVADETWKLYEKLTAELSTADPTSPEGKELEALVLGLSRCIPGRSRAMDLLNHADAISQFPLSKRVCTQIHRPVHRIITQPKELAHA